MASSPVVDTTQLAANAVAPTPATTQMYCAFCGRIETYFEAVVERYSQAPICPIDSRPMRSIGLSATDPDLK